MADRWEDLLRQRLPDSLPAVPRMETPLVRAPTCPDHCARHHVEGEIRCPRCQGQGYRIVNHEWPWSEGHYWISYDPIDGAPPTTQPYCRDCGRAMERA